MTPAETDRLERLLEKLARPIFIWRMARSQFTAPTQGALERSRATRRARALAEAKTLLDAYTQEVRPDEGEESE